MAPENPDQANEARMLAAELDLPLTFPGDINFRFLLIRRKDRLELAETRRGAPGPVFVDFTGGRATYRRRHGGGRRQPLARAAGVKAGCRPTVLDLTGGLGRDAFVLACQGCRVTMVEKHPVLAALLADGLERGARDPEIGVLVRERLTLVKGDSLLVLPALTAGRRPDVIYLDPMYPPRGKSAKVKKEMQVVHALLGRDESGDRLLAAALAAAAKRTVVKRPSSAPPLAGLVPDLVYPTRNNRFDVYLAKSGDPAR